ncbi:M20 family metallo-hydrolase [Pseudohaliea sp.]|uniref:M20 family metallo-hydrolase n=1 Tax=Pseudohaliea sp. TaxID=2740289 RepID=UPI0032EDB3C0
MVLRVNEERLWESLEAIAEIGATEGGGSSRLALSENDARARKLFISWCVEAGCDVDIDAIGNIFATRKGREPDLSAVATGSHLDTQPLGGRFDGVYGVLAGLEVIRCLNERSIETRKSVVVVVWTNEEGVRFNPGLTGSQVFSGALPLAVAHDQVTLDGTTVYEDLVATGFLGEGDSCSRKFSAFIEAHIEQGPILEKAGMDIGVVEKVQGITFIEVSIRGENGHAGTLPMEERKDACMAACEIIGEVERQLCRLSADLRVTCGRFTLTPSSISTVPGGADFTFDIRHPDESVISASLAAVGDIVEAVARKRAVEAGVTKSLHKAPVSFDPRLTQKVEAAADTLSLKSMRMVSGAGHDAMNLAAVAPSTMIFVPSLSGISHNEAEYSSPADLANGASVLLQTILDESC